MNQYTRYLTIAVLVLQAPTYLVNLYTYTACFSIYSIGYSSLRFLL